jgi:transcription elongation factor Elf1
MDCKRRGRMIFCKKCNKKTPHVIDVDKHEKLLWCICGNCGKYVLWDNWS